ncbi:hypothetical protein AKO1_006516, partial [Acrasis kona]
MKYSTTKIIDQTESIVAGAPEIASGEFFYQKEPDTPFSQPANSSKTVSWKNKFLFIIQKKKGISNYNIGSYYLSVIMLIASLAFLSSTNPYVLQTFAKIKKEEQGRVTGDISLYTEVVIILMGWIWGALSDVLKSRKPLFVIGFIASAISFVFVPSCYDFYSLLAIRLACSFGISASLSVYLATLADYTVEKDRGKATGLIGFCINLGSLFSSFVLVNLPKWISQDGRGYFTSQQSGYITYSLVAVFLLSAGVLSTILLHDGEMFRKELKERKLEKEIKNEGGIKKFFKSFAEAITAMRDPVIVLSYIAAFISRMDLTVTSFNSLWLGQELTEAGLSSAAALSKTGQILGIASVISIFISPLLGGLADKMNKVVLLCAISLFSALSFGSVFFIPHLNGWWVYLWIASMGISSIGSLVASNTLISHAAPKEVRGSVMGVYNLVGALGMMLSTKVGGVLFDKNHKHPYYFVSLCAFVLFLITLLYLLFGSAAWIVRRFRRAPSASVNDSERDTIDEP